MDSINIEEQRFKNRPSEPALFVLLTLSTSFVAYKNSCWQLPEEPHHFCFRSFT